jgi:hypothetical protein
MLQPKKRVSSPKQTVLPWHRLRQRFAARNLLLDELQLLERHLQQSAVDGVELRTGAERITQLPGTQALIGQSGQGGRVGFNAGERLQHTSCTGTQQIRDQARQLNMRFLQADTPIGSAAEPGCR